MSGSTTNYAIPYPTGGDTVGASIVQQLAERVEYLFTGWWGPTPAYVAKAGDIITGLLTVTRAAATDNALAAQVNGEAFYRFLALASGKLGWGPGTATRDTFLERVAANILKASGSLVVGTPIASNTTPGTLSADQKHWIWTGTTGTWTLPTRAAENTGVELVIKHRGASGTLTVQRASTDQIFTTAAVTSTTLAAGATLRLVNDGTYWTVV
ncbi:MAG: hypothetical protein LLG14_03970 [Nocardiaceae bacterium]|nr:hypothetical protein [Nocardiaceae bacterium]